jgi:dolichol-phosphate mannosyltransferase
MRTRTSPVISVIVPTRNEAGNVAALVHRLDVIGIRTPIEIIFVDDSTDNTPELIQGLQADGHDNVILIHRSEDERGNGLGGAVVRGLQAAQAPWCCVMDGDLQHPPELIPELLQAATDKNVDLVVASRYRENGTAGNFAMTRALTSKGFTMAVKAAFPRRLRSVSDPMSGFFLVRSAAIDVGMLQPKGFKILLEIIGRTNDLRIAEVPFQFGTRYAGESKASVQEGIRLASTMMHLRFGGQAVRFTQFGLVGVSGLLINTLALTFAGEVLGWYYLLAAVLATQVSTGWNFLISERFVFNRSDQKYSRVLRGAMFYAMNNAALALRVPMLFVLTEALAINYVLSNVISLTLLMVLRFMSADRLIWRAPRQDPAYARLVATQGSNAEKGA